MNLKIKYIVDESGKPVSVILPFDKFEKLIEEYGLDLSNEEIESINKNKKIRQNLSLIKEEYIDYKDV